MIQKNPRNNTENKREGDSMKPKTLQQIEEMKRQTLGLEIEFTGITRAHAAQVVADYFNTEPYYEGGTYYKWDIRDQQGRKWQVMYDSSILATAGSDTKCELVTPILKYEDIETLQEIARLLRKAGAKSNAAYRCGVHIHIGADGHTAQSLRNLANIMASREQLIGKAIRIGANRMTYCQVTDQAFLNRLNTKKPKTMGELEKVWYNSDTQYHTHYDSTRYHMLNLHATFTKGTVEFRLFNFAEPADGKQNGIHAGELKTWIQLCLAMSQQAKMVRTASPKQPQVENERFAMRTWCNRLGLIGEEFKTARTLLMRNLDGDAAWRYGRPAA